MTQNLHEFYSNNRNFNSERQQDNFYDSLYDFGESQLQDGDQNGDISQNLTHIKYYSCYPKDVERKHFKSKMYFIFAKREPTNQFKRDNLEVKFVRT